MTKPRNYRNRQHAGQDLTEHLRHQPGLTDAIALALPRGGVPVGFEVAGALEIPLDVLVVRKLGLPDRPEQAFGALASGGFEVLNDRVVRESGITPLQIAMVADRELAELHRREDLYRLRRPPLALRGRTVILIDDGLATGFTMRAAVTAVRALHAQRIVVASPVGSAAACASLRPEVEALVCPLQPDAFQAVSTWYEDFAPTSDREVCQYLAAAVNSLRRMPAELS